MKRLLLLSVFYLFALTLNSEIISYSEHLTFDLLIGKKKIGVFKLKHYRSHATDIYDGKVEVRVNMGLRYHLIQKTYAVFKHDILDSCNVMFYKQGKLKHQLNTYKEKTGYRVESLDESRFVNEIIKSCGIALYFNEPIGISKSYAERDGIFKQVSFRKDGSYNVYTTSAKEKDTPTEFYYQNKTLQKVVVKYPLSTFSMNRVN